MCTTVQTAFRQLWAAAGLCYLYGTEGDPVRRSLPIADFGNAITYMQHINSRCTLIKLKPRGYFALQPCGQPLCQDPLQTFIPQRSLSWSQVLVGYPAWGGHPLLSASIRWPNDASTRSGESPSTCQQHVSRYSQRRSSHPLKYKQLQLRVVNPHRACIRLHQAVVARHGS